MPDCHAAEDVLEQYSLGRLPPAEAEHLEEHILICPNCQDRLEETQAFVTAMRQAAADLRASPASHWVKIWRAAWWRLARPAPAFAALAAAALVSLWIAGPWRTGRTDDTLFAVLLQSARGAEPLAQAPAGKRLALHLDTTGLPPAASYRVVLVDARGAALFEWDVSGAKVMLPRKLPPGRYWVRLYEPLPRSALVREFGLLVR